MLSKKPDPTSAVKIPAANTQKGEQFQPDAEIVRLWWMTSPHSLRVRHPDGSNQDSGKSDEGQARARLWVGALRASICALREMPRVHGISRAGLAAVFKIDAMNRFLAMSAPSPRFCVRVPCLMSRTGWRRNLAAFGPIRDNSGQSGKLFRERAAMRCCYSRMVEIRRP